MFIYNMKNVIVKKINESVKFPTRPAVQLSSALYLLFSSTVPLFHCSCEACPASTYNIVHYIADNEKTVASDSLL
jgi:hypothetical protein